MCPVPILVGLHGIAADSSADTVFTKTSYIQCTYPYLCTAVLGLQYVALAIILSDSGERMHRDRIPPQQIHAACSIVARGSCGTKRFAEFNGNCESCCSLEQLVALLCAAHEEKSASGTCHPKTEDYRYIRRYLYRPPDLLHFGGCTWTRISRQPIISNYLALFSTNCSQIVDC